MSRPTPPRPTPPRPCPRSRGGFTLIEVLVAMVILGIAVLGMQAAITSRFVGDVARQDDRALAQHLLADRVETIRLDPTYGNLGSYAGTEQGAPLPAGFKRVIRVAAVNAGRSQYTTITVTVEGPGVTPALSQTIAVGAP